MNNKYVNKFNIRITENGKEWFVFCTPVDFELCEKVARTFIQKLRKIQIV